MDTSPRTVVFRSSANPIHLLQLPAELVDVIESRSTIALRGDLKDEAHLVTSKSTFVLKSVQTSNTMVLVAPEQGSSAGFQVFSTLTDSDDGSYGTLAMTGTYIEVLPTAPKLGRIKTMLDQALFRGFDNEQGEQDELGYTTADFEHAVQASNGEIMGFLKSVDAIEIDGRWRMLDPEYTKDVLVALVDSALANGMDLDNLNVVETVAATLDEDYPAIVLHHVFRSFCTPLGAESETHWKLNTFKLTVFVGLHLLSTKNRLGKSQFMDLWEKIPGVENPSLDMLKGFVLVDDVQARTNDEMITYFPKSELSLDPATRFRQLFDRRTKWAEVDFVPFVEDLVSNKKGLDALLLKYARVSSVPGGGKLVTPRFT